MSLQGSKFYIPLIKWACCLLFATAMSLLMKNHRFVQWICSPCLKRTLKIFYLIHYSRDGAKRIWVTYQVVHCHNDAEFEYAQTYHEVLNQTLFVRKYRGLFTIHFMVYKLMAPTKQ